MYRKTEIVGDLRARLDEDLERLDVAEGRDPAAFVAPPEGVPRQALLEERTDGAVHRESGPDRVRWIRGRREGVELLDLGPPDGVAAPVEAVADDRREPRAVHTRAP
jgi:hypothetical protein